MNSLIIESRFEQRLRNKIFKFCNICGDEASSKHFSALSCDACAAFFRRSVSGKKIYRCLYKQNCAIYNITPRRMCKFCRYQKCRQSGMNPDEVRSGSNTPANSPPPKAFSTPNPPSILQPKLTSISFSSMSIPDPPTIPSATTSSPRGFMKYSGNGNSHQNSQPKASISFHEVSDPRTSAIPPMMPSRMPSMATSMGSSMAPSTTKNSSTEPMKGFSTPYSHPIPQPKAFISYHDQLPNPRTSTIPTMIMPSMATSMAQPSTTIPSIGFMKGFTPVNPAFIRQPTTVSDFHEQVPDPRASMMPSMAAAATTTGSSTEFMKHFTNANIPSIREPTTSIYEQVQDPHSSSIPSTNSSTDIPQMIPAMAPPTESSSEFMRAFLTVNAPHLLQPNTSMSYQVPIPGAGCIPPNVPSTIPSSVPSTIPPMMLTNPPTQFTAANVPPPPFPPPPYYSAPATASSTVLPQIPTTIPSIAPTTPPAPTPFMKAFQRSIILENSLFVAAKNPVLLVAYLQPPHDPRILEAALKNFTKISDKFATINNFFMFQYIESAGITLDPKMIEKFPLIDKLINQSLQQYAELIKIRVRNEFEFAALCQLSILKIASEEFPQLQPTLAQNYEIIIQNFYDYYGNEPGENPSNCLSNVSDLTNTIHLIRKTYRNRIADMLRDF